MLRRSLLCCMGLITACGTSPQSLDRILPETAGDWRRGTVQPLPEVPDAIARHGVAQAAETTYRNGSRIQVRVFRMKAPASAFELMQQWRQSEGLAAYQGAFFFVTKTDNADPKAVAALLRTLQESVDNAE